MVALFPPLLSATIEILTSFWCHWQCFLSSFFPPWLSLNSVPVTESQNQWKFSFLHFPDWLNCDVMTSDVRPWAEVNEVTVLRPFWVAARSACSKVAVAMVTFVGLENATSRSRIQCFFRWGCCWVVLQKGGIGDAFLRD